MALKLTSFWFRFTRTTAIPVVTLPTVNRWDVRPVSNPKTTCYPRNSPIYRKRLITRKQFPRVVSGLD